MQRSTIISYNSNSSGSSIPSMSDLNKKHHGKRRVSPKLTSKSSSLTIKSGVSHPKRAWSKKKFSGKPLSKEELLQMMIEKGENELKILREKLATKSAKRLKQMKKKSGFPQRNENSLNSSSNNNL